jgi:RNA polymerase sigma factor (sigma-70 family)
MNDYALLRRYLEGQDDRAFKEIIDRYDPLVYRVAYAKCQDRQLAEDSTTAVFLLLANKASSFGPKSTLAGWLFHAARLMASNALREETRRRKREEQAAKMAMEAEIAENEAIDIETLEKVDDAIARLGSKQRDAVLLRYALGLTIAETAERLGITPVAASKRASRGLEETRRRVGLTTKALCALIAVKLANHSAEASAPATIAHGLISNSHIEMLYKAGIRHMTLIKLKIAASVALGTATLIGAGSSTAIKAQQSVETKLVSVSSLSKNAVKTPVPYSPTALGRDLGDFSAIYHVVGEYPNAKWAKDNAKTEMTKDFKKMIVDKQIISINGHSVTNISDFPIDSMVDSVQEIFGSALNSDVFDLTISQRGDNIVTKTSSDNGYVWLYNGKNTVHGFNNGYVTILSKMSEIRYLSFPDAALAIAPLFRNLPQVRPPNICQQRFHTSCRSTRAAFPITLPAG